MRRSTSAYASSVSSFFSYDDDFEIDPHELAAIRALQKQRQLKTPQQKLLEKFKKKNEKDAITGLLNGQGKLQAKAMRAPRRVRKVRLP